MNAGRGGIMLIKLLLLSVVHNGDLSEIRQKMVEYPLYYGVVLNVLWGGFSGQSMTAGG